MSCFLSLLLAVSLALCSRSVGGASVRASGRPTPVDDEFVVTFPSAASLGLQLSQSLAIQAFVRTRIGPGQAEGSGWLKEGDTLLSVNGDRVSGKSLDSVVRAIAKADLPRVLRFRARNGEHRAESMAEFASGAGNMTDATGSLILSVDGLPGGAIPFVRAMFGSTTSCSRAKVVMADPMSACGQFRNEAELANAIVVVHRGECPFAHKAVNVQQADGFAIVVVNTKGNAMRMPRDESDRTNVLIPSVMVGAEDELLLESMFRAHHHSPIVGRLLSSGVSCESHSKKAEEEAEEQAKQEEAAAKEKAEVQAAHDADLASKLEELMDVNAWPENDRARRRLYFRLSKLHHPDKPGGSEDRFEILNQAYANVNEHWENQR